MGSSTLESGLAALDERASKFVNDVNNAKPGDHIDLAPGVYKLNETVWLKAKGTKASRLSFDARGRGGRFWISEQAEDKDNSHAINIQGDYWQLHGIETCYAGSYGFHITGGHNVLDNCVARENRNSGIQIFSGGSFNLIVNCQSYRNFDPKTHGEDADGFTAKHKIGPGNIFRHCFSYQNSDDGFDFWMAPNPVIIEDCVAYRNGYNLWPIYPFEGDGNGFKFHRGILWMWRIRCRRCISIEHPLNGFDQNHNTGALVVEDCVAIRCGKGFSFPEDPRVAGAMLRNNTSFGCQNVLAPELPKENNHWYPDVPTGVMGPLPRPGHRNVPGAGAVPTEETIPELVPEGTRSGGIRRTRRRCAIRNCHRDIREQRSGKWDSRSGASGWVYSVLAGQS